MLVFNVLSMKARRSPAKPNTKVYQMIRALIVIVLHERGMPAGASIALFDWHRRVWLHSDHSLIAEVTIKQLKDKLKDFEDKMEHTVQVSSLFPLFS